MKRKNVEKHISGIMCEKPGGSRPRASAEKISREGGRAKKKKTEK